MKSGGQGKVAVARKNNKHVALVDQPSGATPGSDLHPQRRENRDNFHRVNNRFNDICGMPKAMKHGPLGHNPMASKKSGVGQKDITATVEWLCVQNPKDEHCMALAGFVREAMA